MHWCAVILELESPNWSHKAGSMKLSKTFWCGEALRVAFNGKRSWTPQKKRKNPNLYTYIPHLTNFTIGKCSQANIALLHRTARQKKCDSALHGAPLYLTLYIALGDIRLGCRYSAMETNYMKVLDTVLQLVWRSEVCSDWFCRTLVISAPADPTLWFYVASTLWLSFCDF